VSWLISSKDLKFRLSKDDEGGPPQMSLTITFNLMKGDRDKEDELWVSFAILLLS
jgi:hypothetical protein